MKRLIPLLIGMVFVSMASAAGATDEGEQPEFSPNVLLSEESRGCPGFTRLTNPDLSKEGLGDVEEHPEHGEVPDAAIEYATNSGSVDELSHLALEEQGVAIGQDLCAFGNTDERCVVFKEVVLVDAAINPDALSDIEAFAGGAIRLGGDAIGLDPGDDLLLAAADLEIIGFSSLDRGPLEVAAAVDGVAPIRLIIPAPGWMYGPAGLPLPTEDPFYPTASITGGVVSVIDVTARAGPELTDMSGQPGAPNPFFWHGEFATSIVRELNMPSDPALLEPKTATTVSVAVELLKHDDDRVISLSGGTYDCPATSEAGADVRFPFFGFERSIESLRTDGSLLVAAAGNGATSAPFYPAAYSTLSQSPLRDLVVGVAAEGDTPGSLAAFSNTTSHRELAPGLHIIGSFPSITRDYDGTLVTFADRAVWSGTSFATPYVSAMIAACMNDQDTGQTMYTAQAAYGRLALSSNPAENSCDSGGGLPWWAQVSIAAAWFLLGFFGAGSYLARPKIG